MNLQINKVTIHAPSGVTVLKPHNKIIHALDKEGYRAELKSQYKAKNVYFDFEELENI